MGKVDLCPDFVGISAGRARAARGALRFGGSLKVGPHLHSFMFFNRTGVSLFFRDAHDGQHIENRFAFDFQLPRQIVNSNLTHPPSISSACPVKPSYQPHGISLLSAAPGC
jgi:hypothetical protein